ncbi:MAG: hypothetical protein ACKVG4_03010 [Longimicrobiales bacterium]
MGVFEFILIMVMILTIGGVLTRRAPQVKAPSEAPQLSPSDADRISEAMDDLSGRLGRLEEERDFYKQLLEAPDKQRGPPSSDTDLT